MYINWDSYCSPSLACSCCCPTPAKPNLPNQTSACILTQTISFCSLSLACSCCCPTPAKPNPCMRINSDYFLLQSIIDMFLRATLQLPNQTPACILTQTISYCSPSLTCSCCCPTPAKPNLPNQTPATCMYINPDYFFLQSIIGLFLLLPYTCQTKLAKPNPACTLTKTISFCSPSLACSCCCPTPAKPNHSAWPCPY